MAEISSYLINQISSKINKKLKKLCFEYLIDDNGEQTKEALFEEFIGQFIKEIFPDRSKKNVIKQLRTSTYRNMLKTKKRWGDIVETDEINFNNGNDEKSFSKEIQAWNAYVALMGEEKAKTDFNAESIDEFIHNKVTEVKDWCKNKEKYVTDFIYLESKSDTQIKKALNLDLTYNIINILIDDYDGELYSSLISRANSFIDRPIFADGKEKLDLKPFSDLSSDKEYIELYNDYIVDDELVIRTVLNNTLDKNIFTRTNYALDDKDSAIIDYFCLNIDNSFYKDRTVVVDVGDLVNYVYKSQSKFSYEEIERKVLRLGSYRINGLVKKDGKIKDSLFVIGFFQNASITTDETGKRLAKLMFTEPLYQQIINRKTVKVYSSQIKSFAYSVSKILIFPLQKERVDCYTLKKRTSICNYTWFKLRIRFRDRKKENNLKLIEKSLQEFKDNNIIVQDYKRSKDSFEIIWLPLTKYEEIDFFKQQTIFELENLDNTI